jgi:peptidyl-tRNA hydrolase, PTH1 family
VLAVIGLGNPGSRYARTRHNAGFMVVDCLVGRCGAGWDPHEPTCSLLAQGRLAGRELWLAKPQTYMNESGRSAAALVAWLGCPPADLLIVVDDVLLGFSRLRLRRGGSDGGHHGLASVLDALHTQAVPRLRLGVGSPAEGADRIGYVLSEFGPGEEAEVLATRGADAVECCAAAGMEAAMNRFNGP